MLVRSSELEGIGWLLGRPVPYVIPASANIETLPASRTFISAVIRRNLTSTLALRPSETDRNSSDREVFTRVMDLKTKLLEVSEGSHYFILIAKGAIDREALKRIFDEIEKTSRPLVNCKVFIDLEEASLNIRPSAIHSMANQFELHLSSKPTKMAIIASTYDRCGRLHLLRDLLSNDGLRVAVFDDTKTAATWLSDGT